MSAKLAKQMDRLSPVKIRRLLTLEGLADVDAGRISDHETVQAWAAGLASPKKKRARQSR